ncbi:MAG: hypothetical protein K6G63_08315 [Eubacterium sp.]|nr:hypothetical protein [Eubacterium sp.]
MESGVLGRGKGHAYVKKEDLACPESGMRRFREREGACLCEKRGFGMPRKWNEEILGERRGMPK